MIIDVTKILSLNKKKEYYSLEWGKDAGQRISTGIFNFVNPKDQIEKNHHEEAQKILETKRSQMILDMSSILGIFRCFVWICSPL